MIVKMSPTNSIKKTIEFKRSKKQRNFDPNFFAVYLLIYLGSLFDASFQNLQRL